MGNLLSMRQSTLTRWMLVSLALIGSACGQSGDSLDASTNPSTQERFQLEATLDDPCTLTGERPTLSLPDDFSMELQCGATWVAPEVTAYDSCGQPLTVHKYNTGDDDGDGVPGSIDLDDYGPGPDTSTPGTYQVQYLAWDVEYNITGVIITVTVLPCP